MELPAEMLCVLREALAATPPSGRDAAEARALCHQLLAMIPQVAPATQHSTAVRWLGLPS